MANPPLPNSQVRENEQVSNNVFQAHVSKNTNSKNCYYSIYYSILLLNDLLKLIYLFSVRINVVGYDTECEAYPYYPISVSQSTDEEQPMINVLLIGNDYTTHYVLIKSLDALLRKKNTRDQMFHCVRYV